jgi:putative ABC transport system permease protein
MILNYLKFYFRSINRRKLFSFINISGLAFGTAFIILIGQFIYNEFSVNRGLDNVENIYRLVDVGGDNYNIDYRIKDLILEKIPGVKNICMLNKTATDLNIGNDFHKIDNLLVVDSNFFSVFRCSFISGNAKDALNSTDGIVLTESSARNIFGSVNVIGKTVTLEHKHDMTVTGVTKDMPGNISFKADMFVSSQNMPKHRIVYKMNCITYDGKDDSQCKYLINVFVELTKNTDPAVVEKQISAFNQINNLRYPKTIKLVPFKINYYNTEYPDSDLLHGNIDLIKILSAIGIIILLLAVINYINLSTAAYRKRLTEIGIKKCFGINRQILIKQLLFESFLTCLISSTLAILLAEILLPYFNKYVDKTSSLILFNNYTFILLFVSFILFLSITAGLFPAVVLSRISPVQLFRLSPYLKGTGRNYRNLLSIVQFSITIILISGLIVISRQINYVKHKDLGFNTQQLMYLKIHNALGDRVQVIYNRLQQYHNIKSLTKTMGIPGNINMICDNHETICIDSTSLRTFGFKIIQGRNLLPGDLNKACLINMASLKKFSDRDFTKHKVNGSEIVGVVSDFHYSSMHNITGPLVLLYNNWGVTHFTMRVSGKIGETDEYIKRIWKEICPDYPLEFGFYDENFAAMYKKEENLAALVSIFSLLAIVISCMGILGLSVFQSELKIKEIGVRKVLGASVAEIIFLLTKSFSKWVLVSIILAIPAAYYLMNKWLQDFAYRIELSWWIFASAGLIALAIALFTVSFQAVKAATVNPVKSLKYE